MPRDPDAKPAESPTTSESLRLQRLRQRRVFAPRDDSLAFLQQRFKQDVARPFRQLQGVIEACEALIPNDLRERSRLESLQRGVLTVVVDSPATHFRFDELVRGGLAVRIAERSRDKVLRKIRLRVDAAAFVQDVDDGYDGSRDPGFDPDHDFDPELPR
ncbi:MAG: DciA family protein [Planctomycetota bacterium]